MKFATWKSPLFWATISVMEPEMKSISEKKGLILSSITMPWALCWASISRKKGLHLSSVPIPCHLCSGNYIFV